MKPTHPYEPRRCTGCGRMTPPQTFGQPRKWCSDECRERTRNELRRKGRDPVSAADRVRAKLAMNPNGCQEFTGYRNAGGYGVINAGTAKLAHRVVFEDAYGPIGSRVVRHRCDNPACCNLDHLELGTQQENMRDRDARGRTLQGEECARTKITDAQVREIRVDSRSNREVAAAYGISKTQVSYIRNRQSRRSA